MSLTRNEKKKFRLKLHDAQKEFTRAKAMRELANGADFNDAKYTKHRNYHIRQRAWELAGSMVPETEAERIALCELLSKGRAEGGVLAVKARLGIAVEGQEEKAA